MSKPSDKGPGVSAMEAMTEAAQAIERLKARVASLEDENKHLRRSLDRAIERGGGGSRRAIERAVGDVEAMLSRQFDALAVQEAIDAAGDPLNAAAALRRRMERADVAEAAADSLIEAIEGGAP